MKEVGQYSEIRHRRDGLKERLPHIHIHRRRPDPGLLLQGQRVVEPLQGFGLPARSHVLDRSLLDIADQRHVLVSLGDGLLVHPNLVQGLFPLPGQPPTARFWTLHPSSQLIRRRAASLEMSHAFRTSIARRSNSLANRPRASA